MKYTAENVAVLSFAYNGDTLNLLYEAEGAEKTRFLSNKDLIAALRDTGYCSEIDFLHGEILVPVPRVGVGNPEFAWVSLDYFVRQNLDSEMAEKIVLNHLNSVTA